MKITECANTNCKKSFRFFNEGQIFAFDLVARRAIGLYDASRCDEDNPAQMLWLCGNCVRQFTVACDAQGIQVVALRSRSAVAGTN